MAIDRKQSGKIMLDLVYPRMRDVLKVHSVEAVADDERIADLLDRECEIDALVRLDGRITTVASRVHPVKEGDQPYKTFTLGLGEGPASTTAQYPVLLRTTRAFGALHPYHLLEAYVNAAHDKLLAFGLIGTSVLIDHVDKYLVATGGRWDSTDSDKVWLPFEPKFCSVRWKVLEDPSFKLVVWP